MPIERNDITITRINQKSRLWMPAGQLYPEGATFTDRNNGGNATTAGPATGILHAAGAAVLLPGVGINGIRCRPGTTGSTGLTNSFAAIIDQAGNVLAKTADNAAELVASTDKDHLFASQFVWQKDPIGVYLAICVSVATTMPTWNGVGLTNGGASLLANSSPFLAFETAATFANAAALGATVAIPATATTRLIYQYLI